MKSKLFNSFIKMPRISHRLLKYDGFEDILEMYSDYLASNKYSYTTVGHYRCAIEHFLYWLMQDKRRQASSISELIVNEFINIHIPLCHCPKPAPSRLQDLRGALHIMLKLYETKHPVTSSPHALSEIEDIIKQFDEYMIKVCGLSDKTRVYHRRHVRYFLDYFFHQCPMRLDTLTPKSVLQFCYRNISHYKLRSFGVFVYSIRCFFKFLQFRGVIDNSMVACLPRITEWKLGRIPEYLSEEDVKKLMDTLNPSNAQGKRDYAMIICMLDLGLRAHEVSNLTLDNINWRQQILRISRGKTHQNYLLPMTYRLLDALIDYVIHGRPQTTSRYIFVYHRAPVGKAIKAKVINDLIVRKCKKAKLSYHFLGSNLLRRTFATNLLHKGNSIKEIADVLRHRSINTTVIYTKVNFSELQQVALPWPMEDLCKKH